MIDGCVLACDEQNRKPGPTTGWGTWMFCIKSKGFVFCQDLPRFLKESGVSKVFLVFSCLWPED